MIKFSSKYLPSLMKFMAKTDIRYYLNGIHIEPAEGGGAILVATDGHRMLIIKDKDAMCESEVTFNIEQSAARFCKLDRAGKVTIDLETQRLTVLNEHDLELFLQPGKCIIMGKFPDWRRVIPDFTKLTNQFQDFVKPSYLADAVMAHPMSGKYALGYGVRIWQERKDTALIVQYSEYPEYLGIIMPLRDRKEQNADTWIQIFGNPKADHEAAEVNKKVPA